MFSPPREARGLPRTLDRFPVPADRTIGRSGVEAEFGRGVNKEKTEPMKKADLVDVVAQQKNFPRPQVEATIDALIEAVADGLSKGDRIDLRGFGAFAVRESAARAGRNPQTGETIQIAARRVPTFKAGKELRDRVNRTGA
jgi:DNA-binding protein HU-beta